MATKQTTKSTAKTAKRSAKKTARKTAKQTAKAVKRVAKTSTGARRSVARATTTAAAARRPAKRSNRSAAGSGDAIAVLKQDHREVEQLFKRFEKAGNGAHRTKAQLVAAMSEALSRHAEIEELLFYPTVREKMPRIESDVLEALEEHHVVKVLLKELEGLDPTAERYDAKVTVLIELVRHHVKEEERDMFPKVRDRIDRKDLVELGAELRDAKRFVPTRPHPLAPDEPPANAMAGAAIAVVDRARTVGKRAVARVRDEIPSL